MLRCFFQVCAQPIETNDAGNYPAGTWEVTEYFDGIVRSRTRLFHSRACFIDWVRRGTPAHGTLPIGYGICDNPDCGKPFQAPKELSRSQKHYCGAPECRRYQTNLLRRLSRARVAGYVSSEPVT